VFFSISVILHIATLCSQADIISIDEFMRIGGWSVVNVDIEKAWIRWLRPRLWQHHELHLSSIYTE